MPLDPKKIVEDARKVGLIEYAAPDADSVERHRQAWQNAIEQHTEKIIERTFNAVVKLPAEAGIARFVPPPKQDRRTGKKPKRMPRYVITKKDRPDLFP